MKRRIAAAVTAALVAASTVALGLPALGTRLPPVSIADAWGQPIDLGAVHDKPVLVMYEDRDSSAQNSSFKSDLSRLAEGGTYESRVVLVAVADVASWNFWPARGFVAGAIKDESRKQRTPIYCDWDGNFRGALHLQRGVSNVVIYGRNGAAVFSHGGPMSEAERRSAIQALDAELR